MVTLQEIINRILSQIKKKENSGKVKRGTEDFAYHELNNEKSIQGEQLRNDYNRKHDYNDLVKNWVNFYCAEWFQQLLKDKED